MFCGGVRTVWGSSVHSAMSSQATTCSESQSSSVSEGVVCEVTAADFREILKERRRWKSWDVLEDVFHRRWCWPESMVFGHYRFASKAKFINHRMGLTTIERLFGVKVRGEKWERAQWMPYNLFVHWLRSAVDVEIHLGCFGKNEAFRAIALAVEVAMHFCLERTWETHTGAFKRRLNFNDDDVASVMQADE